MACQPVWHYFMPRGYGNGIVASEFFHAVIWYQVFLSNTNNSKQFLLNYRIIGTTTPKSIINEEIFLTPQKSSTGASPTDEDYSYIQEIPFLVGVLSLGRE